METFSKDTREEVWIKAINHLANDATDNIEYNLIMEVRKPGKSNNKSRNIRKELDKLLISNPSLYTVNTVAETIFPAAEYKKYGLAGVIDNYPDEIYPIIKKKRGNERGTYALRIFRGINARGETCSPLKDVIKRLKSQLGTKTKIRCAYELPIDEVETIPINRNDTVIQGFPCLSHLSFKLNHDRTELHLTALYRSHDYVQKALGNLLGLARLQSAVARELGLNLGTLVCHSTMARLDTHTGIGTTKINEFIKRIEETSV